jgi:hypothetical protein
MKGQQLMTDKCDKCDNMARLTISGFFFARYLCALHAMELCQEVGDSAGVEKFRGLLAGDRAVTA